ncbi:MAG: MBL fold metallo-hydrolase [Candidatus Helarchaeota archaeon]
MKLTILGSGDTPGTPALNCHCKTCENARKHPEHSRTRFSILIQADDGKNILIDASPDLRFQLIREGVEKIDAVFLTHEHFDHSSGLFNFYRYKIKASEKVLLFAGEDVINHLLVERNLQNILPFRRRPLGIYEKVEFAGIEFQSFKVNHRSRNEGMSARGFLITHGQKKIVVTGDTSPNIPEKTLKMISINPDVAIIDMFTDRNVEFLRESHFILPEAIAFSKQIGAKKVIFVHMSHYVPPHLEFVERMKNHGERFVVGYDGLTLDF